MAVKKKVAVKKAKPKGYEGFGSVAFREGAARNVRSVFDDFLKANPSWNQGLRQLQQMNPGYARGAEQIGSALTGTKERKIQPPKVSPWGAPAKKGAKNPDIEADRRASAAARANRARRGNGAPAGEEEFGVDNGLSFAEALAQALELVGGGSGGVNYDPERNALRERAADADARLGAMYKQLQGSYAADLPGINASYDTAQAGVDTSTNQGVSNINAAYDKARADQTAQLAALGIGDAAAVIAGAGQGSGADQAQAVANLEQNRGASQNQLETAQQSAGAYNTRIGQAAGLEGNLQRASNQSRLQQLLAEIDSAEQGANAQARDSSKQQAFSLAETLMGEDRYNREYADTRADKDFEKQLAVQQLTSKLQGQTAARFDPQQAISATDAYFQNSGREPTPDEWNKVFGNMVRNYSVGY